MHFLCININWVLPKIDELKYNKTKAVNTVITKSELNHTIPDLEVNLPGYDILRCDRNRNINKNLCFNTRALNQKEIENIIFGILLPKSISNTVGRPQNHDNFMELIVKGFSHLNLRVNEILWVILTLIFYKVEIIF